jgi:hypothetical protein
MDVMFACALRPRNFFDRGWVGILREVCGMFYAADSDDTISSFNNKYECHLIE